MQVGKSDQVSFIKCWNREDGVSNLLDVYCAREGGFLRIVALEVDAVLRVLYIICSDRRVMTTKIQLGKAVFRHRGG